MGVRDLSAKRQAFVAEYLIDFNATQAAMRAGYSPRTAKLTGHRLITDDNVLAALAEGQQRRATQVQITVAEVMQMLQREATAGDLEQPNAARIKATELLGKHLGMFTDKVQVENVGAPPIIQVQFGKPPEKDDNDS